MKRRPVRIFLCGLGAVSYLSGDPPVGRSAPPGAALDVPVVISQVRRDEFSAQAPGRAGGILRAFYGEGGRIIRLDPGSAPRILTDSFHSACDTAVSFDGQRVLFAAKRRAEDPWNIWEMNADGSNTRQITRDVGNCRSPAYQSTLYTIVSTEPWSQIMFTSDVAGEVGECGEVPSMSLFSCKLDGTGLRRLTLNLSDDMDPILMTDGRVVLACRQRMNLFRGTLGRVALFGLNTDGTDYALYADTRGGRVRHMPCETGDGWLVFVEADRVAWDGAGRLGRVSVRRPLHTYESLTRDDPWVYHSPSALPNGELLVSRRSGDGSDSHTLCVIRPGREAEVVFDDSEWHEMHAAALISRSVPDGRSSVVNEDFESGRLYCLNVYNSDDALGPYLSEGTVRRLRVLEGVPRAVGAAAPDFAPDGLPRVVQTRLLGEVDVESDGSFNIEVPADVPIQLQTLDADGMSLASCGWIWVKHRESRGCIGCHEDGELSPENRFVEALKRESFQLLLPPEKRRTVDFRRDVMPILASKCATSACHGGETPAPPDLKVDSPGQFTRAYESLLAGLAEVPDEQPAIGTYVHPGRARTSPLVWLLAGRNTSRPWDATYGPSGRFRKHPPILPEPLTAEEQRAIVEWIDLGALWNGVPGADGNARRAPVESKAGGGT